MEPTATIVVPAWNEEQFLYECLKSIRQQTLPDFQVIIVNDGSTDQTKTLIDNWCGHDPRFRAIHKPANTGIGDTLNTGFAQATGRYVTWISADSWVEPFFLATLVDALDSTPDAVMAYSDWLLDDGGVRTPHRTGPYYKKRLQRECYIGVNWLMRRDAKERAGDFCHTLCEDYYMHLLMAEQGEFVYVPEVLGAWRNHPNNCTNRISAKSNWRESSVAKAEARWKSARYKIAYVCPDIDCAGVGWLLTNGINDLSQEFAVRHIMAHPTYMNGGHDLIIKHHDENVEIQEVLAEADLIYFNNEYPDLNPFLPLSKHLRKKPSIFHLHGGPICWNTAALKKHVATFGSHILTCTPGGYGQWVPNFMPVATGPWPLTNSRYYEPSRDRVWEPPMKLLCHHNYPTGKGVDAIVALLHNQMEHRDRFQLTPPPFDSSVRCDLKMGIWDHLLLKRKYHVCIDQITHGYIGMASWEAMAQEMAVIGRCDPTTMAVYRDFWGEVPPIVNCRLLDDVAEAVFRFAGDLPAARQVAAESREWVLKHYNANQIVSFYESVFREVLSGSVQQR